MAVSVMRNPLPAGVKFNSVNVYAHILKTKTSVESFQTTLGVEYWTIMSLSQRMADIEEAITDEDNINLNLTDVQVPAKLSDETLVTEELIYELRETITHHLDSYSLVDWLGTSDELLSRHDDSDFLALQYYVTQGRQGFRYHGPASRKKEAEFQKIVDVMVRWKELAPELERQREGINAALAGYEAQVAELERNLQLALAGHATGLRLGGRDAVGGGVDEEKLEGNNVADITDKINQVKLDDTADTTNKGRDMIMAFEENWVVVEKRPVVGHDTDMEWE